MYTRKFITSLLLLQLCLLHAILSNSQTYIARYKGTITSLPPKSAEAGKDSSLNDTIRQNNEFMSRLLSFIPIEIHVIYDIVTDGRFMIVNAKLDSAANEASGMHVNTENDDEAVIDIENQLIFFTGSRKLRKMKLYTLEPLQTDTSGCRHHQVGDKAPGYTVKLCNNIPGCIFPGILFAGINAGVKTVIAPGIAVRLYYFAEKAEGDKRLKEYSKYFKQYPVSGIEEGFLED